MLNGAKGIMIQLRLVNVMEEIVSGLVRFYLRSPEYQTFCHCEECEMKIIAKALNGLPSYYVTTENDRNKAFDKLKSSSYIEKINKEIVHAIHVAGKRKNHSE